MKARNLKLQIAKCGRYLAKFYAHNSFKIFLLGGGLGWLLSIFINKLGGLPTLAKPAFWVFSIFGAVILFDLIGLILQPKVLNTPIRPGDEYDPALHQSGGKKQVFMWCATVIFLSTASMPLVVFLVPIIVGIVFAVFDNLEEKCYEEGFWWIVVSVSAATLAVAVVMGYLSL